MRASILVLLSVLSMAGCTAQAAEPTKRAPLISMDLKEMDLGSAVASLSSQTGGIFVIAPGTAFRRGANTRLTAVPLQQAIRSIAIAYGVCVSIERSVTAFQTCESARTDSPSRARLGVSLRVTSPDAESAGVPVRQVFADSIADRAGIQPDDVILSLDGRAMTSATQLRDAVLEIAPGGAVTLEIMRGERRQLVIAQF